MASYDSVNTIELGGSSSDTTPGREA